ncbi:MAG: hypothetical protein ABSG53_26725 [Thermoguttaceae bacterium]|jgi:hypothetical protein
MFTIEYWYNGEWHVGFTNDDQSPLTFRSYRRAEAFLTVHPLGFPSRIVRYKKPHHA